MSKLEAQTNNVESKVNNLESKIDELITNQKHVSSLLEKLTEHNLQFRSQVAFSFIDFFYIIMDEIKKLDSQKENLFKLTNSISGNSIDRTKFEKRIAEVKAFISNPPPLAQSQHIQTNTY